MRVAGDMAWIRYASVWAYRHACATVFATMLTMERRH